MSPGRPELLNARIVYNTVIVVQRKRVVQRVAEHHQTDQRNAERREPNGRQGGGAERAQPLNKKSVKPNEWRKDQPSATRCVSARVFTEHSPARGLSRSRCHRIPSSPCPEPHP